LVCWNLELFFTSSDEMMQIYGGFVRGQTHRMNFHPAAPGWKMHPMSKPLYTDYKSGFHFFDQPTYPPPSALCQ
jgi:hypothetical protein